MFPRHGLEAHEVCVARRRSATWPLASLLVAISTFAWCCQTTVATSDPGSAGSAAGLADCGADADTMPTGCCAAVRAWEAIAASGGCGGGGADAASCDTAAALCRDCGGVLQDTVSGSVTSGAERLLGAVAGHRLQCVPLRPPRCDRISTDIGLFIVFLTGVVLLVMSIAWIVMFDMRVHPQLVRFFEGKLLGAALATGPESLFPRPVGAATGKAMSPCIGEGSCDLKAEAYGAPLPPLQVSSLQNATPPPPDGDAPPRPSSSSSSVARKYSGFSDASTAVSAYIADKTRGVERWPARLAHVWASRTAFMFVAWPAALARGAHTITCALAMIEDSGATVAIGLVLCLVPIAWCSWTSKPPAQPDLAAANGIAYICRCVPRFTTLAVAIALVEVYSTFSAAWYVATASCDTPPWRTVTLHCVSTIIAVLRVYSAILALRVQDDFVGACRRVLPTTSELQEPQLHFEIGNVDRQCGEFFEATCESNASQDLEKQGKGDNSLKAGAPSCIHDDVWNVPSMPLELPCSISAEGEGSGHARKARIHASCLKRLRRRCGGSLFIKLGLGLVVFIAAISVLIARAVSGDAEGTKPRPPSSCRTAQNGTSTCEQFSLVGNAWDAASGDTLSGAADTLEDCCQGCDDLVDCQAWMFERTSRRCRWIKFSESTCAGNPGDLRCRCYTHGGQAFGFKPKSQIVWLSAH